MLSLPAASAEERALTLYHAHTKESATIVFKRNGRYDPDGLARLNRFMRDWRTNAPTKMDPKLFDILWEAYRQSGARQPITVIGGYRAPETNDMLRRRSSGVAQNSLHVKGQAIDFHIPGVDLARLRAIGLKLEGGGVGFYPSSGSPFVHLDTGSVRHWPRMSRSQLVKVFPDGKTLHVPSDGKPLPGYAQALAAYKLRQARGTAVASVGAPLAGGAAGAAVTVASADEVPLPRLAPDRTIPVPTVAPPIFADAALPAAPADGTSPLLAYPPQGAIALFEERFGAFDVARADEVEDFEELDDLGEWMIAFDAAYDEAAPQAPADLLAALAGRRQPEAEIRQPIVAESRNASVPIQPTAVVSTVDIDVHLSRPLRADAITTAVLRGNDDRIERPVPPVLAYAPFAGAGSDEATTGSIATFGVPQPAGNPVRAAVAAPLAPEPQPAPAIAAPATAHGPLLSAKLTLTKLDTQSLRLWIAAPSTREKRYALLTMPDFSRSPSLLDKPGAMLMARFEQGSRTGLRTDRFDAGGIPAIVDLTTNQVIGGR